MEEKGVLDLDTAMSSMEEKGMTFKGKTEMADGQQLMVRSGISVFCRIELVGKNVKGFKGF